MDFHPLLIQLQTRYLTSHLTAELLHIHDGQFVVRAMVKIGDTLIATGMAMATTVEAAEDQARLRVLALLGITAAIEAPGVAVVSPFPLAHASSPATVPLPSVPSTPPLPDPYQVDTSPLAATTTPTAVPWASAAALTPSLELEPTLSVGSGLPPLPTTIDQGDDRTDIAFDHDFDQDDQTPPPAPVLSDFEPNQTALGDAGDRSSKPMTKAKKAAATDVEPDTVDPPPSRDLSSLISQIGVEIDRIGWTKRQGSTYLQKTYGKKTRSELDDDELADFLAYLQAQPGAHDGLGE